ncbi:Tox-REase-5 domain-containing protein [Archangium sp.]|jgi:hypothetical protein|uniref:Tox-REase-5 domain-containing protein n=1 Tax=Archangium sp. TaxID=1872627 RepID=UPI002EDB408B
MSARLALPALRAPWRGSGSVFLALVALVLLDGCATAHPPASRLSGQGRRSLAPTFLAEPGRPVSSPELEKTAGSAGGFPEQEADAFQLLQKACGLEERARHPVGAALSADRARQLWGEVTKTTVTQKSFGPRLALSWLLREQLTAGDGVEYAELLRRTERFSNLVLVRPDGYLVAALSGRPVQRMGQVTLTDGELKVGRLVVGVFYVSRGGVLYPVDESLRRSDRTPWAELGLERDWLNAALDGAQDAMGELALALAQSLTEPIRTVEGLKQLPTTVALLIASSPEYFARYGALSPQDQIREAARLSTHLLLMYGGTVGTAGTVGCIGALGAELPVLSVTAEGLLAVRTVAVSGGTVTTTLGAGVGAVTVLHMAASGGNWVPPTGGPGKWVQDTSSMSERARAYQAQVTDAPRGWAYEVCRNGRCVEYDGYDPKTDTLLEAKGEGYDPFFDKNLNPVFDFKGLENWERQARRQAQLSGGLRIRWHVAEPRLVAILQKLFARWDIEGIEVVYTPPLPLR